MPIVTADLVYRLATVAGAAGNTLPSIPNASLGKYVSTTSMVNASLENLFDAITGPENTSLDVEYRCVFVLNNHATLPLLNTVVWIEGEIPAGAVAAISVDTTGVTPKGQAGAQAKTIANENTAPAAQVFTAPTTKGTGLVIGTIAAGSVQAVWVQRSATNSAPMALDAVTLRVEGDTAA